MQKKKNRRTALEQAHIPISKLSKEEFQKLVCEDREMPTASALRKQGAAFMKEAKSTAHILTQLKKITGGKTKKRKQ